MRWPDREIVDDESQGVRLETMQELARYWGTDYDWRKVEARLQALPQFITEIDGVDIHFIHVRSKHDGRLADHRHARVAGLDHRAAQDHRPAHRPEAHGAAAEDAFDVVIPSLPGHGFSGTPTATGWDPDPHRARVGDLDGAARLRAVRGAGRRLGERGHGTDGAADARWDCSASTRTWRPRSRTTSRRRSSSATHRPRDLSEEERYAWDQLDDFYKHGLGYAQEMANRPQTLYALEDSPVGLAAWMLDHDARSLSLIARVFDGEAEGLTKDDILDNVTLYWLTKTAVSSARLYWESKLAFFAPKGVDAADRRSASSPTRSTPPRGAGRSRPIRT